MTTGLGGAVMTIAVLTAVLPVSAAPVSDAHCADRVDFAIRTAERLEQGKTQAEISEMVANSARVFAQQYPDLDQDDMQRLVKQVFEGHWTRFAAARNTIRECAQVLDAAGPAPASPPLEPEQNLDGARS